MSFVLTQKDADRFERATKKYIEAIKGSPKKARAKLVALGIYTPAGQLTKNYR